MPARTATVNGAVKLLIVALGLSHTTVPSWPAAPKLTTSPALAFKVQAPLKVSVCACAAAKVKLLLIVRVAEALH